ncbi:MAG: DUF1844 domain-containing protein [Deltaproteobacteria bacterium]|nr:DUF1844 domain-containing protein [Deltaproteobacteria bacterium]
MSDAKSESMPYLNFSTFVMSLVSSGMVHLDEVPDPETGQRGLDLPLAKQTIDLLTMLQEKTKGNLDQNEERLLQDVLFELRMVYVRKKG